MKQIKRPTYDYTHLYAAMYNAIARMEPTIIGDLAHFNASETMVRKFKIAKELAKRIANNDVNKDGYAHFQQTLTSQIFADLLGPDAGVFKVHYIKTKGKYQNMLDDVQEKEFIELLTKLIRTQSKGWWD